MDEFKKKLCIASASLLNTPQKEQRKKTELDYVKKNLHYPSVYETQIEYLSTDRPTVTVVRFFLINQIKIRSV